MQSIEDQLIKGTQLCQADGCTRRFFPATPLQKYCGITCKKRAERARARMKDPARQEIEARMTKALHFQAELFNPSVTQLEEYEKALEACNKTNIPMNPVKVSGRWDKTWTPSRPGVGFNQVIGEDYWILYCSGFDILEMLKQQALAEQQAQPAPPVAAGDPLLDTEARRRALLKEDETE